MKIVLYKTIHHFFPSFGNWLKGMNDPRNENAITYSLSLLLWTGILLFLVKLGSRRQINFQFNSEEVKRNLSLLVGEEIEEIAHDGTLEYLLERFQPEEMCRLRKKMINRLIRMRCLENDRLFGYYKIVIDASGYLVFKERHCQHCLKQEKNGKVLYYHPILEAKIVSKDGIALSIDSEFIENPEEGVSIQDCELAAFRRLAERLKKSFSQLKICLLLDALYANKGVFKICRKNNWKYIITFKKGSMPAAYEEYIALKKLNQDCWGQYIREGINQEYRWVNAIDYEGYDLNVLECRETKSDKKTRFVWLTNFDIDKNNYHYLANKGGRLRWKIENEGFNMQKKGGYNLEHPYSKHPVGLKNFYLLLQIAHIINQLMEKGSLLKNEIKKTFGSIRNIARRLLESLRTSVLDETDLEIINSSHFQIRLQGP